MPTFLMKGRRLLDWKMADKTFFCQLLEDKNRVGQVICRVTRGIETLGKTAVGEFRVKRIRVERGPPVCLFAMNFI